MIRPLLVVALVALSACSSSSSSSGDTPASCPDLSGDWTIAAHCDASLVGQRAVVRQTACALAFAAPFDGFTGSVAADGKVTLSGPQSCTGTATAGSIALACTPGTCNVTLAR